MHDVGDDTIQLRLHILLSVVERPHCEGGSSGPWLTTFVCLITSLNLPLVGYGKHSSPFITPSVLRTLRTSLAFEVLFEPLWDRTMLFWEQFFPDPCEVSTSACPPVRGRCFPTDFTMADPTRLRSFARLLVCLSFSPVFAPFGLATLVSSIIASLVFVVRVNHKVVAHFLQLVTLSRP